MTPIRKTELAKLMESHRSSDWKLILSKKHITVYTKSVEVKSESYNLKFKGTSLLAAKTVTKINCDMKTVFDAIKEGVPDRLNPLVSKLKFFTF